MPNPSKCGSIVHKSQHIDNTQCIWCGAEITYNHNLEAFVFNEGAEAKKKGIKQNVTKVSYNWLYSSYSDSNSSDNTFVKEYF